MIDLKKSAVVLALALAMVACATVVVDESDAEVVDGYQYLINGDAATVIGYVGTETVISIPSQIEINNKQCTVVGISDNAFKNQNIVDVTIPETVTSIGDGAFSNCKQLQYVCITGDVKIWSNAFLNGDLSPSLLVTANSSGHSGISADVHTLAAYPQTKGPKSLYDINLTFIPIPLMLLSWERFPQTEPAPSYPSPR